MGNAALLAQLEQMARHRIGDAILLGAQSREVDLRLGELDPELSRVVRPMNDIGGMQERLRRNATNMEAGAARLRGRIDERRLNLAIRREKGSRVPAGSAAENEEVGFNGGHVLIHLQDMFAAVGGIADESVVLHIDDEIETFERYLSDQSRHNVRYFSDFNGTNSTLDGQPDNLINTKFAGPERGYDPLRVAFSQPELLD